MDNTEGTPEPGDSVETTREALQAVNQLQRDYEAAGSVTKLAAMYGIKYRIVRKMLADAGVVVRDPGRVGRENRWANPENHEKARTVTRQTWENTERREQQSKMVQRIWADPEKPLYHWDRPGHRQRQREAWLRRIATARERGDKVPAAEVELREALKRASLSFEAPAVVLDGTYIVDILLAQHLLVIEADGVSHNMRYSPERDKIRQCDIEVAGYHVVRFRYQSIADDADQCVSSLMLPREQSPVFNEGTQIQALNELMRIRRSR
jgi:very-short-patch-repair endonuclease